MDFRWAQTVCFASAINHGLLVERGKDVLHGNLRLGSVRGQGVRLAKRHCPAERRCPRVTVTGKAWGRGNRTTYVIMMVIKHRIMSPKVNEPSLTQSPPM